MVTFRGCLSKKNLSVVVDNYLKRSHQCAQVAKKANGTLACNSSSGQQEKGSDHCLYSALVRPHLKSHIQFWTPHHKTDIEMLEHVQRRATELVKGLEHRSDEEQLRELGVFSLE
ncbi:hypothetical protein DUI87_08237 [Hirundo rustica rustica]|uniref:Uncharacterized protein n=1 Tax=Hirundo rustica rustica TaxID=333673 RepID=A0A3M0KZ65_HIRRU|nr:hypothetical protein DUI87_08237 [Hirundo rustica rustica]